MCQAMGNNDHSSKKEAGRVKDSNNDLDPLEEQIILRLATAGPKDIDETAKEVSAKYEPVYAAFGSLEKKEMVMPAGRLSYRGRDYDTFWLTEKGLLKALLNGVDSSLVLKVVKKTFLKYDDMSLFAQVACRLPERALRIVSSLYPSVSLQVGIQEVLKVLFMASDLSVDELKTLYDIVRRSPHHRKVVDETIKNAGDKFEQLKKIIGVKS
jgi:hypothetical protein